MRGGLERRRRAHRLVPLLLVATVLCSTGHVSSSASTRLPTEYEVKAAYLYNFARFVQWPDDAFSGAQAPFVVAVLGDDPFGPVLEEVFGGKRFLDREATILRTQVPREAATAHLVFISGSESRDLTRLLREFEGRPVLTVADGADMARSGAVIGFRLDGNKVRFDVNLHRADEARLKLSSQLLRVARIVEDEE